MVINLTTLCQYEPTTEPNFLYSIFLLSEVILPKLKRMQTLRLQNSRNFFRWSVIRMRAVFERKVGILNGPIWAWLKPFWPLKYTIIHSMKGVFFIISSRATLKDTSMAKNIAVPSWTPQGGPKSIIYTPKRDDEHPRHFRMGVPDFSNLHGKRKSVREIGNFEISGVKLQWKQVQGKQRLVREIGGFEKSRVREIEVPLYGKMT